MAAVILNLHNRGERTATLGFLFTLRKSGTIIRLIEVWLAPTSSIWLQLQWYL